MGIPRAGAARLLRNLCLTVSVLRTQASDDFYVAGARVLRALPGTVRARAARLPTGAGALARALGNGVEASVPASARAARRAVRIALAVHDNVSARLAFEAVDPCDVVTEARLLAAEGFFSGAMDLLGQARGRRARRVRDLVEGERALLAPVDVAAYAPGPPCSATGDDIVHVVTNALPETQAGYTVRTHGIARAQVRAGKSVVVVPRRGFPVTSGAVLAPEEVVVDGVRSVRDLPWRLPRRADERLEEEVASLTGLVRRTGPAVLHAHSNFLNARVALRVRAATGVPVVYEVRGFLEETWRSRGGDASSERFRLVRESETQAMRAADHVVTISEGMADEIRGRGVDHVTVVPNSVDDSFLEPLPDAHALRERLGIEDEAVVVGIVSTLNAYEGVDVLIDAVARLQGGRLPLHLLVVGDGPERRKIASRAAGSLGNRAHVVGRVPYTAIRDWFAAIDVFAVPRLDLPVTSRVTPIKPLEAMATAKPVVASDLAPLREIVEDGKTGWFARPGDREDLARVLRRVVEDEAARSAAGDQARAWVGAQRTWARAAAIYDCVYGSLMR